MPRLFFRQEPLQWDAGQAFVVTVTRGPATQESEAQKRSSMPNFRVEASDTNGFCALVSWKTQRS